MFAAKNTSYYRLKLTNAEIRYLPFFETIFKPVAIKCNVRGPEHCWCRDERGPIMVSVEAIVQSLTTRCPQRQEGN